MKGAINLTLSGKKLMEVKAPDTMVVIVITMLENIPYPLELKNKAMEKVPKATVTRAIPNNRRNRGIKLTPVYISTK